MTKCRKGHELNEQTLRVTKKGNMCTVCDAGRKRRYATKSHYWDWYRFGRNKHRVLERDSHACVVCFTTDNITVDHIDHDRSNNELSNLQTLCRKCHGAKDGRFRWPKYAKGASDERIIRIDEVMKVYWAMEHAEDKTDLLAVISRYLHNRLTELDYPQGYKEWILNTKGAKK